MSSSPRKPCNLPPSIGSRFLGRDVELAGLFNRFIAAPRVVLHGPDGAGKTRLAVEYGWRHAGGYNALLVLHADSVEALRTNLAELAGVLELPERELKDDAHRTAAVLHWLNNHPGWLLIVDGADGEETINAAAAGLQALSGGHILITSRVPAWPLQAESLGLSVLDQETAGGFLLESTPGRERRPEEEQEARRLAAEVNGMPLALRLTAAVVEQGHLCLAGFRDLRRSHAPEVDQWYDRKTMSFPRGLATTWQTAVSSLSIPAQKLLGLLAWLAPQPWPISLLLEDASPGYLKELGIPDPAAALDELDRRLLVDRDGDWAALHPLVAEISRRRLVAAGNETPLQNLLLIVSEWLPTDVAAESAWPRWNGLAVHLAALLDRVDPVRFPAPADRLANGLALNYKHRGRLPDAERLQRQGLALAERSFGPNHPTVAVLLNNLAFILKQTGRPHEALPLMQRALAIDERCSGPEHPDTAFRFGTLAKLLMELNRLSDAEPLLWRALAIDERSFGPDHPCVAGRLDTLARLLQQTQRPAEAVELTRRALAIEESEYGPDASAVGLRLNNLSTLLQLMGRLEEAEPLSQRATAICERTLAADDAVLALVLSNRAELLRRMNRLEEAAKYMRLALIVFANAGRRTRQVHPQHTPVFESYLRLLTALGRSAEEIQAAQVEVLGPNPPPP